jgi:hypothetical protein
MSVNDASLLSYRDLSGQSKNAGIVSQGRKGCTNLGWGLPFPKVDPAISRRPGVRSSPGRLMSALDIPTQRPAANRLIARDVVDRQPRAALVKTEGSALIFARPDEAIESIAFSTIGDSLSGIIRQQRIRTSDLGGRSPRTRLGRNPGSRRSLLGLWRCGASFMRLS